MNRAVLVLCLLNLALIGVLPRIFFRRGRLNLRWWLTAAPFFAAAGVLLAGLLGLLPPVVPVGRLVWLEPLAVVAGAGSIALIAYTLGTHAEPVSLWHQEDDLPGRLVLHGAYARVRHPFYLAFLLALAAALLAFPHPGTAATLVYACVQLNRTAAREERRLLASPLGADYERYLLRSGRFWPRPRAR